jgi:hypothetical protein
MDEKSADLGGIDCGVELAIIAFGVAISAE